MKQRLIIGGIAFLVIFGGGFAYLRMSVPQSEYFSLEERVESWDLSPAYQTEEMRNAALGRIQEYENHPDATTFQKELSISTEYKLLGDGKLAYEHLLLALEADPQGAVAYHNLGALLKDVRALESAEKAYKKAIELLPGAPLFHLAYIEFLTNEQFDEKEKIADVFQMALTSTNGDTNILKEFAVWLEMIGAKKEALEVWKSVLLANPSNMSAVEDKIRDLEKELGQ